MMSVQDISRRRAKLRSQPPGFCRVPLKDKNNNSANLKVSLSIDSKKEDIARVHTTTPISGRLKELTDDRKAMLEFGKTKALNLSNRRREPVHHMMSVVDVARKRAKNHSVPPGFSKVPLPMPDTNNNSKGLNNATKSGRRPSEPYKLEDMRSKGLNNATQSGRRPSAPYKLDDMRSKYTDPIGKSNLKSKMYVPDCVRGLKSELSLAVQELRDDMGKLGPDCLKAGSEVKARLKKPIKEKIELLKKAVKRPMKPPTVTVQQREEEIEGEIIIVNVFTGTISDEDDCDEKLEIKPRSPDNYGETYDFFERETKCRLDVFQAFYRLGDMLLMEEIEGELEEWKAYVLKSDVEATAWKEKCKRSMEYFEKTRKILGQEKSVCDRITSFVRKQQTRMFGWLGSICPCF